MNLHRRLSPEAHTAAIRPATHAAVFDWTPWLRQIERKRRLLGRLCSPVWQAPVAWLAKFTAVSFRLDGMDVTEEQVALAAAVVRSPRRFRSRLSQRLRNHLAILRSIQRMLLRGVALRGSYVVRWYTSISCGLSTTSLDDMAMDRIETVVGRLGSPRLRLQSAVQDISQLHSQLIADPLVPSFNGILARLLLFYHLGRCGLPPVMFDAVADQPVLHDQQKLLPRLMSLIDSSFDVMLADATPTLAEAQIHLPKAI